jgi:hypothetical protein
MSAKLSRERQRQIRKAATGFCFVSGCKNKKITRGGLCRGHAKLQSAQALVRYYQRKNKEAK